MKSVSPLHPATLE